MELKNLRWLTKATRQASIRKKCYERSDKMINFKSNKRLKLLFINKGITQQMIAEELGVTEFTLCRWLRTELSPDKKTLIIAAIDKLKKEVAANGL